eukprot:tig00021038_g17587.t1
MPTSAFMLATCWPKMSPRAPSAAAPRLAAGRPSDQEQRKQLDRVEFSWSGLARRRVILPRSTAASNPPPRPPPSLHWHVSAAYGRGSQFVPRRAPGSLPKAPKLQPRGGAPRAEPRGDDDAALSSYLMDTLGFSPDQARRRRPAPPRPAPPRPGRRGGGRRRRSRPRTPQDLPKVLAQCPHILSVGIEPLREKIQYFHSLGVLGRNFRRMCALFPAVLTLDLEGTLRPNVALLRDWGADPVKVLMTTRAVGLRRENLLAKVEVFRALAARREDVRVALKVYPRILMRSRDGLLATVEKLRGIGYTDKALASVLRHYPAMYNLSPEFIEERMRFFRARGFSPPQLAAAMARSPGLLTVPADKVRAVYAYFGHGPGHDEGEGAAGVPEAHAAEGPGPLAPGGDAGDGYEDGDDEDRPGYEEEEEEGEEEGLGLGGFGEGLFGEEGAAGLGMSRADITKMLTRAPSILDMALETSVAFKIELLRNLGLDARGVASVLRAAPTVLHLSLEESWLPRIRFLESLGIERKDVARMIRAKPGILYASMEGKVEPLVEFLKERGADDRGVARILAGCPTAVSLALDSNLRPKVEYLASRGYGIDAIEGFPSVLHRSLETRVRPRLELARLHPRLAGRPLGSLLPQADAAFAAKAGLPPARLREFAAALARGELDEAAWRAELQAAAAPPAADPEAAEAEAAGGKLKAPGGRIRRRPSGSGSTGA